MMSATERLPESLLEVKRRPVSPYARTARNLVELGYPAIPIIPGEKRPGRYIAQRWQGMNDWSQYCNRLPTDEEVYEFECWPDAGVCLPLGKAAGLVAIDLDYGSEEVRAAIESLMPHSPVRKKGSKGYTAFYRFQGDAPASRIWKVDGKSVCELLSQGRQTVLPPTIHPEGMVYSWETLDTLESLAWSDMPELSTDFAAKLDAALKPFQTHDDRAEVERANTPMVERGPGVALSFWEEINQAALVCLDQWVPVIFPGVIRTGEQYRVVAHWRDGEKPNVSIDHRGIRDWAAGTGHTPIDIVMLAMGIEAPGAAQWLREAIGMPDNSNVIDFETFRVDGKTIAEWTGHFDSVREAAKPIEELIPIAPPRAGCAEGIKFDNLTFFTAQDALTYPLSREYYIKGLVAPWQTSVWYGPSGSGKSFLALDLFYRASMPGGNKDTRILGRRVHPTKVCYIALEAGEGVRLRLQALIAKHGPVSPNFVFLPMPISFVSDGDDKNFKTLMKAAIEMDFGIVVVDTLSVAMGGEDENSPVGMGKFMRHLAVLVAGTGAHVAIIHHTGKDVEKGERGHSSLRAGVDVMVEISGKTNPRGIKLKKNKEGADGIEWGFNVDVVALGLDDDRDLTDTCTISEVAAPKPNKSDSKMNSDERMVIQDFEGMFFDQSTAKTLRASGPGLAGHDCITRDQLRAYFIERSGIKLTAKGKISEADRKRFERLLAWLCEIGVYQREGNLFWPTKSILGLS